MVRRFATQQMTLPKLLAALGWHAMYCQLYCGRETSMAGHGELYATDVDE